MKNKAPLETRIHVAMTKADRERLEIAAADHGVGVSTYARILILNGLTNAAKVRDE